MAPRRSIVIFTVLFALSAAACRREVQLPATHRPPTVKTVIIPEDERNKVKKVTVPITPTLVQSVRLGVAPGASGAVEQETTRFQPGQPVYVTMTFKEVPAGSAARVVWRNGGKTIGEERRDLAAGAKSVTFKAPNAESWKRGKYSVDAFMGGDEARTIEFEIAGK